MSKINAANGIAYVRRAMFNAIMRAGKCLSSEKCDAFEWLIAF